MLTSRLVFADKPAGLTTHSSLSESERSRPLADLNDGFVEALGDHLGAKLFVNHRLDRDTTGAIVFARDPETAARLQELFAGREVKKRYLFLTDRAANQIEFTIETHIERRGSLYVSSAPSLERPANARTTLRRLAHENGISLWEALPETGKPHQIRLHAESCGIPILGDKDHGGSAFPTLCLHSAELRFVLDGEEISHATPPPIWFESRELVTDRTLIRWLAAVDRRARLLRSGAIAGASFSAAAGIAPPIPATDLTLRWIHSEGDPLRAEQLGPVHWLSWYSDTEPSPTDLDRVRRLTETLGWRQWVLQLRGNRGRAPNEERRYLGPEPVPERWQGTELSRVRYEFRADQGLSPGLFLDQRRNRAWVLHNAQGLRVLNLFCYTGGFSVCAALGGAERVVSVDVSKPFLEWSKTNFVCNGLCTEGHEFRAMDSRDYLEWARKKNITFDLVICDPPSFGRSKSGVFTMEKDFARLFEMLLDVTAPQGRILFSSNYERWSLEDFAARAQALARGKNIRLRLEATPSPDWDFELPRAPRNMKSFFAVRI